MVLFLLVDGILISWWFRNRGERRHDAQIFQAARRYRVHPALVKAVIWRESAFDASARGSSGEIGLMQIRELAAQEWAAAEKIAPFAHLHLIHPETNTLAGAWYLGKLLKRYHHTDNPIAYALADYNAGRTHVLRWMKGSGQTNSAAFLSQIDYPGTRRYLITVQERYEKYRKALLP